MAVNSQIASIIANAYNKLGVIGLEIIHNYDDGYGLSEKQNELRKRLIKGANLLGTISKYVEFNDAGDYVAVHQLSDEQINDHLKLLVKVLDIQGLPVAPKIFYRGYPYIRTQGSAGPVGDQGIQGPPGGGTAFSNLGFSSAANVVDRFAIADSKSARWDYELYGSLGRRTGTVRAIWSDDGLTISTPSDFAADDIGTTLGNISFTVEKDGTDIVLVANRLSGTWSVRGLRWFPSNNAALPVTGFLPNGQIYVGDSSNAPIARTPGGVLAMTNTGVFSFVAGSIVNADVNAAAAIAYSKLNLAGSIVNADVAVGAAIAYSKLNLSGSIVNADIASGAAIARGKIAVGTAYRVVVNDSGGALSEVSLTANRALASDNNGLPKVVATTDTELGYVNLVTSPIQAQIDGKQAIITGAATTVTTADLTPNRLLVSDASGKIAVSAGGSGAGVPGGALNELQKNGGGVFSGTGVTSSGTGIFQVTGNYLFIASGDTLFQLGQPLGIAINNATNNAVTDVLKISHQTSGSPALGIGVGMHFETETSAANNEIGSIIQSVSTNVGSGTEAFDLVFKNMSGGSAAAEKMRIKSDGNIDVVGGIDAGLNGKYLKTKVLSIGDWNMDSTGSVTVAHGLSDITKIVSVTGMIIRDDSTLTFVIDSDASSISNVTTTVVTLTRTAAGFFDSVNFDATGFNRGWITIEYEA